MFLSQTLTNQALMFVQRGDSFSKNVGEESAIKPFISGQGEKKYQIPMIFVILV